MAKISITVEPDQTGIDTLLALAKGIASAMNDTGATATAEKQPAGEIRTAEVPEDEPPFETGNTHHIAVEDIRAAIRKKTTAGKRDAVKELLELYGADSATALDAKYYEVFLEKLEAL